MREFTEIERRIERVTAAVASGDADDPLLAEMGDLLAVGYALALRADACSRRLGERIERMLHAHAADESRRLADERRAVEERARGLRTRLGVVRSSFARASARPDSA